MESFLTYIKQNVILVGVLVGLTILGSVYLLTHQVAAPVKNEIATAKTEPQKSASQKKLPEQKIFVVDIQGAVNRSGVYRLKNGAIVQEALQMAGGITENADVKQLNQAQRITDQMQIYVPYKGEQINSNNKNNQANSKAKKQVNLNTATVDDFKDVSGIGPKKAEKIIAYREKNGNFKELHDLTKVGGFGEKSLDALKEQLTV
ncbi:competence protein CelA [Companilactobacillus mindensis DSM 14500]|jgi:competence protein ComEA helix-hairpin-helix repeat region|uniref:Competence protein CelA n=1 Tax=Companilactobacillus mindensis DSM 14500 TaxID=1423770 RepID=A0A0R1QTK9_9LACO|nr:helix-hairpin-helix domain-containing protein [Companilactobacillus mindensis]KRL45458.1 competence protein CelA [Companilactobacillus mindensis DSM 14500]GEO77836.1 competence protein CelA [Companilactobacillus mindensis]